MCRRGKFILFTFCRACAQSRASHDEACLQQNKASTMTTIYFIPCHHGVSPQKNKKKTKKKKGKRKNWENKEVEHDLGGGYCWC